MQLIARLKAVALYITFSIKSSNIAKALYLLYYFIELV